MPMFMMLLLAWIENIVRQYDTILLQNADPLAKLHLALLFLNPILTKSGELLE